MEHYLLVVSRGLTVVFCDNGLWFHCVCSIKESEYDCVVVFK